MDRSLESNSRNCWYDLYYHLTKHLNRMIDDGGRAGTMEFERTRKEIQLLRPLIREKYQH